VFSIENIVSKVKQQMQKISQLNRNLGFSYYRV